MLKKGISTPGFIGYILAFLISVAHYHYLNGHTALCFGTMVDDFIYEVAHYHLLLGHTALFLFSGFVVISLCLFWEPACIFGLLIGLSLFDFGYPIVGSFQISTVDVYVLILVIVYSIRVLQKKETVVLPPRELAVAIAVALGVLSITTVSDGSPVLAVRQYLRYCEPLLVYLLAFNTVRDRGQRSVLVYALCTAGTALAVVGIGQFLLNPYHPLDYRLVSGTFKVGEHNLFSAFLNLPLMFILSAIMYGMHQPKILRWIIGAGVVMVLGQLVGYSRGGWMMLFTGFITMGLVFGVHRQFIKAIVLIVTFIVGAVLVQHIFGNKVLTERISGILADPMAGRTPNFALAFDTFKRNPLLGIGTGQFASLSTTYENAHSMYLQVLAENGIAGLTALLYLIIAHLVFLSQQPQVAGNHAHRSWIRAGVFGAFVTVCGMQLWEILLAYSIDLLVVTLVAIGIREILDVSGERPWGLFTGSF